MNTKINYSVASYGVFRKRKSLFLACIFATSCEAFQLKIKNTFRKYLWVIILAIVVFLAYGQTLNMYFWVDDWGMAYKMRYPEENIPNFGAGVFGEGAYRYTVTPFIWLYPFLGFNAQVYFAIGLIFYFLASLAVYFLTKELSRRHSAGVIAATIFASGYIGSYAMYRLSNSYQLVHTAIAICAIVWLLLRHYRTDKIRYYLASLLVCTATIEFLFLRAHGILIAILSVGALSIFLDLRVGSRLLFLLKQPPFVAIWYFMYFVDPRVERSYDRLTREDLLPNTINTIFGEGHFELFNNLLITFSSVVFPDVISGHLYKTIFAFWDGLGTSHSELLTIAVPIALVLSLVIAALLKQGKRLVTTYPLVAVLLLFFLYLSWSLAQSSSVWSPRGIDLFRSSAGGGLSIILIWYVLTRKRKVALDLVIPFSIVWILGQVAVYFIYSPHTNLESTSRYLIPAFIGTCLILGSLLDRLKTASAKVVLTGIISVMFIVLVNKDQAMIIKDISKPTKSAYELIKKEIPAMNKNTVFYIETEDDPRFKGNILGGMPQLAIPLALNYHGMAQVALSYDEIFYLLKEGRTSPENVLTFFSGKQGFINTSDEFRRLLTGQATETIPLEWKSNTPVSKGNQVLQTESVIVTTGDGTLGANPVLEASLEHSSVVPNVLTLEISIKPINLSTLRFPYIDTTSQFEREVDSKTLSDVKTLPAQSVRLDEYLNIISAKIEREEFEKNAKTTTTSAQKSREAKFMNDGRSDTSWEGDVVSWNKAEKEEIRIDLGRSRTFSKLAWVNHHTMDTPTNYQISISNDGKLWVEMKSVENGDKKGTGELVVDDFPTANARYSKMSIAKTFGGKGHAPALDEIWVGNTIALTEPNGEDLLQCPFCYAQDEASANKILGMYERVAKARVWWITDRGERYFHEYSSEFPIFLDGLLHTYNVFLPAQGTKIKKVKFDSLPVPVTIKIQSASLQTLSLDEMVEEDLILNFAD